MIITANSLYLHVPKTAGTWMRHILQSIQQEHFTHQLPKLPLIRSHVFVIVRNPWDWYVSYYTFHKMGSEMHKSQFHSSPVIKALPNNCSFEDFVRILVNADKTFKNKVTNFIKLEKWKAGKDYKYTELIRMYEQWAGNSDESYYSHLCNAYTEHATRIGTVENIRNDFLTMLKESNDLTMEIEEQLNNPAINVTNDKQDYRSYYTSELKELVEKSSAKLIQDFNYEF